MLGLTRFSSNSSELSCSNFEMICILTTEIILGNTCMYIMHAPELVWLCCAASDFYLICSPASLHKWWTVLFLFILLQKWSFLLSTLNLTAFTQSIFVFDNFHSPELPNSEMKWTNLFSSNYKSCTTVGNIAEGLKQIKNPFMQPIVFNSIPQGSVAYSLSYCSVISNWLSS